ncbi:uncharacterized protein LY79DRAFT_561448 [Colletotrichum navitas]|uniref:Uncharacterized protein n=1 Tax=Colletotrichum navitas TaxID=681940 RepID=A0AAD8V0S1_9PEZI|nr:uncharacterized protein LY79DRAFT_561448 [Colletotrichum navitas]KAK1580550.1 hypothetical protein LY79DRAFT_561448 [Colletotrichum navitas]
MYVFQVWLRRAACRTRPRAGVRLGGPTGQSGSWPRIGCVGADIGAAAECRISKGANGSAASEILAREPLATGQPNGAESPVGPGGRRETWRQGDRGREWEFDEQRNTQETGSDDHTATTEP